MHAAHRRRQPATCPSGLPVSSTALACLKAAQVADALRVRRQLLAPHQGRVAPLAPRRVVRLQRRLRWQGEVQGNFRGGAGAKGQASSTEAALRLALMSGQRDALCCWVPSAPSAPSVPSVPSCGGCSIGGGCSFFGGCSAGFFLAPPLLFFLLLLRFFLEGLGLGLLLCLSSSSSRSLMLAAGAFSSAWEASLLAPSVASGSCQSRSQAAYSWVLQRGGVWGAQRGGGFGLFSLMGGRETRGRPSWSTVPTATSLPDCPPAQNSHFSQHAAAARGRRVDQLVEAGGAEGGQAGAALGGAGTRPGHPRSVRRHARLLHALPLIQQLGLAMGARVRRVWGQLQAQARGSTERRRLAAVGVTRRPPTDRAPPDPPLPSPPRASGAAWGHPDTLRPRLPGQRWPGGAAGWRRGGTWRRRELRSCVEADAWLGLLS